MSELVVVSKTQIIEVTSPPNTINVEPSETIVKVIDAGPIGPSGLQGIPGEPGSGDGGPSEFQGVVLTRLQNILINSDGSTGVCEPIPFTDMWDNSNNEFITWDENSPADLLITQTGWYWVGANITSLGTGYSNGTNNSDLTISILKNYPGVVPILSYMISVDRFHNVTSANAQCNSLPPKPVYLVAGDVIQVGILNNIVSHTLLESNPGPAMPGAGASGVGPGILGPHLYVVSIPGSAIGPQGASGDPSVIYASTGNPNNDDSVASPPNDIRSRVYDVTDNDRLYYWGLSDDDANIDTFTGSDGTNIITSYTGPNGEDYSGTGSTASIGGSLTTPTWVISANKASGGGDVYHSWFGENKGASDGTMSVVLGTVFPGDRNGLGLRHLDHDSYVAVYTDGTDIKLAIVDVGVYYVINTWPGVGGTPLGKILEVEMIGNVYTVSFDGTLLGSFTDTENNYLTQTSHGVISYQGATTFDDLSWVGVDVEDHWVATDRYLGG